MWSQGQTHHSHHHHSSSAQPPAYSAPVHNQPPPPPSDTEPKADTDKYDDVPIETKGRDCPPPITSWKDVDLGREIQENIEYAKYTKPTPVQKYSLPIVMKGRDMMGCAQTGSGKTAAFLLPILIQLCKQRSSSSSSYDRKAKPEALVLAPTRELTSQIFDECKKFSANTRLKACVVFGGVPMYQQLRELERGCNVLIATPGRLVDILERGKLVYQT